ncbi:sporulation integral membrane protein YtvI [Bacillus sp. B15-48]|uniref:sporulation integral membrane protein YtvI n=1 Tax=Bacillus sp. B15-48 TaxID=1548601 RepID=UPI00193F8A19|nr:sporulation integral membrane protein YtvI [Bacillus sp. B15-48]MBM4762534.1 sporulation integral membrane protein YtvI [Bacillus sp. B15-48]
MNHIYLNRIIRLFIVTFIFFASIISIFYLSKLIYPFIIGLLIAFLINPFVNFFEVKMKVPRTISVFIVLFLIFTIFASLITLLVVEIVAGAEYLSAVVPTHIETLISSIEQMIAAQIIPLYNQVTGLLMTLESGQQEAILENIQTVGAQITTVIGNFAQGFLGKIPNILGWFPNAATVVIFSLLGTFFISKDWHHLRLKGSRFLTRKAKSRGRTVLEELKKALLGFITAQTMLISISTVSILIGLIILRVEYAITIAIVAGLVDIIPYLGTGVIFVPWIIFEAIGGSMHLAIGLAILYILVIVQRQLMEPKILSSNIGLDPLATLVSLFVGYKLWGFLGLFVGPVILVLINALYRAGVFNDLSAFIKGDHQIKP